MERHSQIGGDMTLNTMQDPELDPGPEEYQRDNWQNFNKAYRLVNNTASMLIS